jgi:hypothetical protein
MTRAFWERWERAWYAFGLSPWSSAAWTLFMVLWIACEAMRTKAIGWDGFGQWALGEIALSTIRRVAR